LSNNTFESNGQVVGPTTGFNGLEFFANFSGTALISGNTFRSNTGNGLFIGSAPQTIQVVNNLFDNNFVGLTLDASDAAVNATVQGNTFTVPTGAPSSFEGLFGLGSGVTATIGGPGSAANTFVNYANFFSIDPSHSGGNPTREVGCPNFTILTNTFLRGGSPLDPGLAIKQC
jgi:hypothetical protein